MRFPGEHAVRRDWERPTDALIPAFCSRGLEPVTAMRSGIASGSHVRAGNAAVLLAHFQQKLAAAFPIQPDA